MEKKGNMLGYALVTVLLFIILVVLVSSTRTKACMNEGYDNWGLANIQYEEDGIIWEEQREVCEVDEVPMPVNIDCDWIFFNCEVVEIG